MKLTTPLLIAATAMLSGCAGYFDSVGKEPTMSPVTGVRKPIDPALAGTHPLVDPNAPSPTLYGNRQVDKTGTLGYPQPSARPNAYPTASIQPQPGASQPGYDTGQIRPQQQQVAYAPQAAPQNPSLWRSGPQSLFGDRRARGIGDILTVEIEISDEAQIDNTTTRSRAGADEIGIAAGLGIGTIADTILPGANTLSPALSAESSHETSGAGTVARGEDISLKIAATVMRVLPNGHFLISGNQEVRVNFELRDLQIAGIVRPEDISRRNTITYDKIANARISYGGRGQITDLQQPRIGRQLVDKLSPF
ncbi:MAG: flagellar basal body L-ring protein FlgH [Neomegalonema sp.]|nr:flagellar basal body L-ring protein FlgH [Neomegalonema sp.]